MPINDAHRSAPRGKTQWDYFFCTEQVRVVQKDNTVSYKGEQWQILRQQDAPRPGQPRYATLAHDGRVLLALARQAPENEIPWPRAPPLGFDALTFKDKRWAQE